jgi:DHA1 family bicyclomycin/chloramphenicol resistance-like MFS transporter
MDIPTDIPAKGARALVHVPLWVLTLLVFSGTLGMHIFVPALPLAATDLGTSIATIQQTVSVYILGLAIAGILYGPISDRFGRRQTLIGALVLYTVAGLVAAFAAGAQLLIVARFFQAVGGGAGLVLGRAMVRDTSPPEDTTRRLAMMNLTTTLGPVMAPIIGSIIAAQFGWRPIFWVLCALGVTNLFIAWRLLPETHLSAGDVDVKTLARNYGQLVRSPRFLGYCLGGGCATTAMYAFIAAAPFIFMQQLGRTQFEVGVYLAILIVGVTLASFVATRLNRFFSNGTILVGATLLSTIAAFAYLGVVLLGKMDTYLVVFLMFTLTFGVGCAAPSALTQAMNVNTRVIGSASGLYGFSQMAIGAFCTAMVGIGSDPALAAGIILATATAITQISFWSLPLTRHRP